MFYSDKIFIHRGDQKVAKVPGFALGIESNEDIIKEKESQGWEEHMPLDDWELSGRPVPWGNWPEGDVPFLA